MRSKKRADWKAALLNYDDLLETSGEEGALYCLSDRTVAMLLAQTDPLHWVTRYYAQDEPDKNVVNLWASDVEKQLMASVNCSCGGGCIPCGALTRWTIEGVFQISFNGGEDWEDFPQGDTRNTVTAFPQPPTPEGQTGNCYAANNFVANFHELMDAWIIQLQTVATVIAAVDTLAAILAPFTGGISLPAGAIIATVAGIFGQGATELDNAWNEDAYHELFCCALENIPEDGVINGDVAEAIRACFRAEVGGLAADSLDVVQIFEGVIAFANMAKLPIEGEHDCDECIDCADCDTTHVEPPPSGIVSFDDIPSGWALHGGTVDVNHDWGFTTGEGEVSITWPAMCVHIISLYLSGTPCDFTAIGGTGQTWLNVVGSGIQTLTLDPNEVITGVSIHTDDASSIAAFGLYVCD